MKTNEDMDSFLSQDPSLGWVRVKNGWEVKGTVATVLHHSGDPIRAGDYDQLLPGWQYNTAICLGTYPTAKPLSATARDGRVLSIMLCLRMVCNQLGRTMHVIGENAQDQTGMLSMGPKTGTNAPASDFINIQVSKKNVSI